MADEVARVQALKAKIAKARTDRANAQARIEQAQTELHTIYTTAGVWSIEELQAKAAEARAEADRLLTEAESALA